MKIGAKSMIHARGRPMTLRRGGVEILNFIGVFYNNRPETEQLDYSEAQQLFRIIASADDFASSPEIFPVKFDVVIDRYKNRNIEYTVQTAYSAGAADEEVFRITVKGGQP